MEMLEAVIDIEDGEDPLEIITKVVDNFVEDIRKEYCYQVAMKLSGFNKRNRLLEYEVLNNMVFKKLYADESTWECMVDYAESKLKLLSDSNDDCQGQVLILLERVTPEGMAPQEYIDSLVDKAYKSENY